jgi:hypothetical protein
MEPYCKFICSYISILLEEPCSLGLAQYLDIHIFTISQDGINAIEYCEVVSMVVSLESVERDPREYDHADATPLSPSRATISCDQLAD